MYICTIVSDYQKNVIQLVSSGGVGSIPTQQREPSVASILLNEIGVSIISSLIVENIMEVLPMIDNLLVLVIVVSVMVAAPDLYIKSTLLGAFFYVVKFI